MTTQPFPQVALLPGHGYACTCGETFNDLEIYKKHMLAKGRQGGHKSAGKVDLTTKESVNHLYYKGGRGSAKMSTFSDMKEGTELKDGQPDKKDNEPTPPKEVIDESLSQDNSPPPAAPAKTKKEKKKEEKESSAARVTDNLAEATQIRFVPKVYQVTLTPILQITLNICYNVLGWPKEWPIDRVLDELCLIVMKEHGINIFEFTIEPEALEALRARHDGEEVPT